MIMDPDKGCSNADKQRSSVVLPAPLGPTKAVILPEGIANEILFNARKPGYSKLTFDTCISNGTPTVGKGKSLGLAIKQE